MKIKPLFDKIVLKPDKEEKKESAIIIPDNQTEKPIISTVIAVGSGGKLDGNEIEIVVKEGDKVLCAKYVAHEFKLKDEEFLIISQQDILAIIE